MGYHGRVSAPENPPTVKPAHKPGYIPLEQIKAIKAAQNDLENTSELLADISSVLLSLKDRLQEVERESTNEENRVFNLDTVEGAKDFINHLTYPQFRLLIEAINQVILKDSR